MYSIGRPDFTREEIEELIAKVHKSQGADLEGIDLSRAELRGVNLYRSGLLYDNLSEVNLSEANLRMALLYGANLRGARLLYASLNGARLLYAIYNKYTRFPEGFDPDAKGMVLVEYEQEYSQRISCGCIV